MDTEQKTISSDHDLIVEIKTELRLFREESRSSNDYTKEQLIKLGENKVEKDSFTEFLKGDDNFKKDHESRLRFLERWIWTAVGVVGFAEIIIGWFVAFKH